VHRRAGDDDYGPPFETDEVVRGTPRVEGSSVVEHVEARGGPAFLVIGRGSCAPSVVPVQELPGYARREAAEAVLHIAVPTCSATLAGTIAIPAGPFIYGGVGEPPSAAVAKDRDPLVRDDSRVELPAYRIDKTEVTNAAFARFASMARITGIDAPKYPSNTALRHAGDPPKPVTGIPWRVARDYCRYLGKRLPSSQEWVKAMRGGERLPDGQINPMPRRNLPWGIGDARERARLDPTKGVADVGTHPGDESPYGVLDLAGNAMEWTDDHGNDEGTRIVRGGSALEGVADYIVDFMAVENPRVESQTLFYIGMRCAVSDGAR
jgi:eukaryotic-like serine/threonine-protein kinase